MLLRPTCACVLLAINLRTGQIRENSALTVFGNEEHLMRDVGGVHSAQRAIPSFKPYLTAT